MSLRLHQFIVQLLYVGAAAPRLWCVYFPHHVSKAIFNNVISAGVQPLWALVTVDCCFQGGTYIRHSHTRQGWNRRRAFASNYKTLIISVKYVTLTVICGDEDSGVFTVADIRRLAVQWGGSVDSSFDRVHTQPACRVTQNRIPETERKAGS